MRQLASLKLDITIDWYDDLQVCCNNAAFVGIAGTG